MQSVTEGVGQINEGLGLAHALMLLARLGYDTSELDQLKI